MIMTLHLSKLSFVVNKLNLYKHHLLALLLVVASFSGLLLEISLSRFYFDLDLEDLLLLDTADMLEEILLEPWSLLDPISLEDS